MDSAANSMREKIAKNIAAAKRQATINPDPLT